MKFWSGLNMIDLKILNIWPREVLELLIKQIGKMAGYIYYLDSKNNQWRREKYCTEYPNIIQLL